MGWVVAENGGYSIESETENEVSREQGAGPLLPSPFRRAHTVGDKAKRTVATHEGRESFTECFSAFVSCAQGVPGQVQLSNRPPFPP